MATTKVKNFGKKFIGYPEERPSVVSSKDWVKSVSHDPKREFVNYFKRLFPILGWITRYNVGWLTGDVIAGLTVGIVLVPQSMSYATIATLPPQYGLYSAFVGVMIYCLFATSKDVSIGPVAVMSLTVSQIIKYVDGKHPHEFSGPEIATAVAFIAGFIVLGIGLLRLGWIVELIPLVAVSGFMTGSAINIAAGQVPGLMGITGFDTRAATYKVIINTLKGLPRTTKDAAFGLTGLFALYAIRMTCDYLSRRYPRRARVFFFISVFRNAFVVVVLTIAAWLYTRHRRNAKGAYPIKILQTVPRGFQNVGSPSLPSNLLSAIAPKLPVATIILLLEHIAISKSFGRLNGYKIDPNQELIAIGVTNTVGSVFNAYPATGSFSRSALKSKSGVRTPAAGILSGIVVIVALYGLTPAFYWIPTAGLSAVIIHAVADLVAKPPQVYGFWRVSPLEFIIWWAAVLVTIFSTIEDGIYTSICASAALLIVRLAHPRGHFLGRVKVHTEGSPNTSRDVFVPLTANDVVNPQVRVEPPSPGVLVYRFEESIIYPNSSVLNGTLVDHVKAHTRRGKDLRTVPLSDRPWNDPGPRFGAQAEWEENNARPLLHAIVLDFSTVSHVDQTAVQALVDTRVEIERWVDAPVEFHFATILSPWIRRALVAGGFGSGRPAAALRRELASVVPYEDVSVNVADVRREVDPTDVEASADVKGSPRTDDGYGAGSGAEAPLVQHDTPFFHLDLPTAVAAAESGLNKLSRHSTNSALESEQRDVKHRR
ncbi:sulfate permease [Artomyces pyxidatus]|uniref:Sulfate permease n=1 Tax=Artomyces pyxidatus TaxID=48021 RepID=A0ACB8SWK0_9AGAM|nr:sulfate permease [Artomyces pyxidatus]